MKVEDMEELWANVDSFLIKVDLLEAENQRLKEANGRLKKYNGELRRALIKENAQDYQQVIQIPDDEGDGDSQLLNNKSVEEVSQTLESFDVVVFDPNIMDLVFENLDVKNIKKCRLICKNWNETVSPILSRKNGGYGLAVRLQKGKLKGMTDTLQQHTIVGLSSIIASAPQHWFSNALLDKSFTRRTEIQSVLLDFGHWLRSIEITGTFFLFQDVHKILVDWCPNLEQLALPPYLTIDEENSCGWEDMQNVYQQFVFTRPLKLTGLFTQSQLCYHVVKASPNLKTLSLRCDSDECSLLQFSTKLEKLAIKVVGKFQPKKLSEVLEKLGGTLEKLVIISESGMDSELVFLGMNNLTELRYLTNSKMPINSIKFLTDMPNLKSLYLGEHELDRRYESGEVHFIDDLFSDCEQLRRNPRKKLKELYLFGIAQFPSPTFEMINTIFPNLTKLVVGMSVLRHCNDWEESQNSYAERLFGGISELPNLKNLYLDIRRLDLDYEQGYDCTPVILNHLNKLSNVRCVTIRDNSNLTTSLNGDIFLKIPNLRQVTLIGLKLDRLEAKQLTILLYKHDIQFDIEDSEVKEDFRDHFEEQLTFRSRKLMCF